MDETAQVLSDAVALLRRAGIRLPSGSLDAWDLTLPDGRELPTRMRASRRPPTPTILTRLLAQPDPARRLLVVTPRATAHLRTLATNGEVDVIAVNQDLLVFAGERYDVTDAASAAAAPVRAARGRKPWVRWALARALLLSDTAQTQHRLAELLGVSQQAVSHALKQLQAVRRTEHGWLADSPEALLAEYLAVYPGPGGAVTYWYGLDPVIAQATTAVEFCTRQGMPVLVSGDPAADVYAPWRLPTRAMLYTDRFVDLTDAGFSPATEAEHSLAVQVPADPTLWRTAAISEPALLADPPITAGDVLRTGGPDAAEAADHVLATIRQRAVL
ncbi:MULTISPECIES: hypothetical protein [Rhodococcus]|uniref:hypothetical protein n=1 Tax=Rhodococcus TaxID=1827 RepID=UPI0007CD9872|nr:MULTISPECIES: hypothetical protein [Rhodococcus]MBX4171716.1 hypothetical protein [Rhodococcus sp. DMU2021]QXF82555.1 hypothetical protein HBA53_17160 [Rhodococcus pyridinivorans]SEC07419.1 hypothetical protein SAMN04490240_1049 [Rhodococcus pyridinivorans]